MRIQAKCKRAVATGLLLLLGLPAGAAALEATCTFISYGDGWTGRLDHCYNVEFGAEIISYSRTICVYRGSYGSAGAREVDASTVNRC